MIFIERMSRCWGIFTLVLLLWIALVRASPGPKLLEPRQLKQTLCSSQNTASTGANFSIWQSNGLCQDFCRAKNSAFAIVQYQSCWCSNVAPASSTEADVDDECDGICPGYDFEHCGSRPNWYGYLALGEAPTSTADGGGDDTTSTTPTKTQAPPAPASPPPPPPPPASPTTVQFTVTETEIIQNKPTVEPESTTTSSSTTSTSSKPGTTVQTVTANGTVKTVTVTPTATGTEEPTGASDSTPVNKSSGNGVSTGAVVGIVVGLIAAVVALAGLGLFVFFKRRKQRMLESEKLDEPSHRGSSAGMTGSPRNPEMVVTVDGGRWDADSGSEQRRSRLMAHDPRMDPLGRNMYMRNKSAESINTIRDDQDYSRKVHQPVLRATNPDPDPE